MKDDVYESCLPGTLGGALTGAITYWRYIRYMTAEFKISQP